MSTDMLKHAAEIVEAYVSNNEIGSRELPGLLRDVYGALASLSSGRGVDAVREEPVTTPAVTVVEESRAPARQEKKKPTPFVSLEDAVTEDAILCLICGKACKALKGHLTRSHKLDFEQYRKMFDLDKSFPMVAPSYSDRRRTLAIEAGLGDKLRESRKQSNPDG